MRIGIFGGTFNPIHNGHVALAQRLVEKLELDEIMLIPAALPPHKDGSEVIAANHRLEMCRLAAKDIPNAVVSDIEINRGGKSYTVSTLRLLLADRPDDEFVLLMGGDMFLSFMKWRAPDEILRIVRIAAIPREKDELPALIEQCEKLNAIGGRTEVVDVEAIEISSTELRHERELSNGVPPLVERYIVQNGLYGREQKLMVDLDEIMGWLRTKLSHHRFIHTLNVANEALRLAQNYGLNGDEAYIAGLLHDCCKEIPYDEMLNILKKSDIINDQAFLDSPKVWHGYAAAEFIRDEFSVHNIEILNAVRYHTTGRGEMSPIEEVIYLADLVSAERSYPGVEALRAKCYRSIEEAMMEALDFMLGEVAKKRLPLLDTTAAAYNRYRRAVSKREINEKEA